ncbi:MAG: PorT family protein [Bacteroidales bacterium]|nr:PorT family protein [Bacteroidales bacterium]
MKRLFITLAMTATCISFSNNAFSQFFFGVRAGFQMTTQSTDVNSQNLKHPLMPACNAGVFGEYFFGFSGNMSLTADLLYSMEGRKDKYDEKYGDYTFTQQIHFIDLPIAFNLYLLDEKLDLQVGPEFGFALAGKNKYKYNSDVSNTEHFESGKMVKEEINMFNVGVIVGANYYFTEHIFAGLRASIGLTNSLNEFKTKTHTYEPASSKNHVFSLNVGYRF